MALGRGLESLIKNNLVDGQKQNQLVELDINLIKPNPDQPRHIFDQESLDELSKSIKNYGILEPIIVKKDGDSYIIIAGERRWRAVKQLGQSKIPSIVTDNENNIFELSIIENLQREDLNIVELAQGYDFLINEYNYTHQDLADKLGVSRTSVSNVLRILNLSEDVLNMLQDNTLSYGQARPLLGLKDKDSQSYFAHEIVKKNLNVRQIENLIKKFKNPPEPKEDEKNIFVNKVNDWLSEKYDTNVVIRINKDRGKVEFKFSSLDQLNTLVKALGYSDDII